MHPLKHGKEIDLVEIGANWYVDDLPPMMFMKKAPNSHGFVNPRDIEELWRDQFDWVYREMDYAVFAFTIHPDVSGRPQVLLMLERLIEHINGHDGVEVDDLRGDRRRLPQPLSLRERQAARGDLTPACARACGFPAAPGHWTEAGARNAAGPAARPLPPPAGAASRRFRAYGLTAHDDGVVPGIQIGTPRRRHQTIVRDLEEVWSVAERLAGRPVDPLDPRFTAKARCLRRPPTAACA